MWRKDFCKKRLAQSLFTHNGIRVILTFFKKILGHADNAVDSPPQPKIYPRSAHCISRAGISDNALRVLQRLNKAGFEAYLVGGCVRDLLLGREPKDFDIATNARPEQVRELFRNCRVIGRRFRLAHIVFGREIIEVATFRGSSEELSEHQIQHEDGRVLRDNVFGSLEEDVWRRDFTVNALYYNIRDFSVVDYTGGMIDHASGVLRLIGDPAVRYREDPVRMLRAIRFAVKLGFKLAPETEQPIVEMAGLLRSIPPARLYDETLKLFLAGYGLQTFEALRHYGLFAALFPAADKCLSREAHDFPRLFIARALANSDGRYADGKSVTPYFLFAAFLWEPLQFAITHKLQLGDHESFAHQNAASDIISKQVKIVAMPKHITQAMRDVWLLQSRFSRRTGAKPFQLLEHPKFRAAFDFLALRAEIGGADPELVRWWEAFQIASEAERERMTTPQKSNKPKPRRRSRSGAARRKPTTLDS